MIGFILAAGFGKRMGVLTERTPKPLLPVAGVPLIYYSLFLLTRWGVRACIINTHHLGDRIETELRHFTDLPLFFSRESPEILGTAGGLRHALPLMNEIDRGNGQGREPSALVLLNPDTLLFPGPSDAPDPTWLDGAESCLSLRPRPPESPETAWSAENTHESSFRIDYSREGSFYYIGYALVRQACVAPLGDGQYAELGPIWRAAAPAGRLRGHLFEGKVVDAGTRAAYDLIRERDPVPDEMRNDWRAFLRKL